MKKLLICIFTLIMGIMTFTGCEGNTPFEAKTYTENGSSIKQVIVDVHDREIEVKKSSTDEFRIEYYDNEKEFYNINLSSDGILTMTAKDDKEWSDYIGKQEDVSSRKIVVYLPNTLLENLKISTTNENVYVSELFAIDNVTIENNSGDITIEKLNVNKSISLTGKNGNIKGTVLGSYDDFSIESNIKKGENNLPALKESGTKKLIASNNNGNIDIVITNE